ncbi:MAG: hypothetical protein AAF351_16330 [Pseudomonadota bacterium]
MVRIRSLVFLLIFSLSGCVTPPLIPETLGKSELNTGNGILIGSISRAPGKWSYSDYTLYFRELGADEDSRQLVSVSHTNTLLDMGRHQFADDFESEDSSGSVFASVLKPGEYEFYQYYLYKYGGTGQIFQSAEDFSVRFTIKPGQVLYIGEFRATPLFANNLFGMSVPASVDWSLHFNMQRDLELIISKFPQMDGVEPVSLYPNGCETVYSCADR